MPLSIDFINHKLGTAQIQCGVTDSTTGFSGMAACTSAPVMAAIDALTAAMSTELTGTVGTGDATTITTASAVAAAASIAAAAQAAIATQRASSSSLPSTP